MTAVAQPRDLAAVVLAGGEGRRLGGVDKALLELAGSTALQRTLAALAQADPVVVAGPRRSAVDGVRWAREDPPGGGPAAGLAAAVETLVDTAAEWVAVLACDLPFVSAATVDTLRSAATGHDGALLVDTAGERQPLVAVYRLDALRRALSAVGNPAGVSMRALLRDLDLTEVADTAQASFDVDDPADLEAARERASH